MANRPLKEPNDVLFRIERGLTGYVSYLAACEMNESFSEYILYEPILRILTARGYEVKCEVTCPGIIQKPRGDKKKLDFVATLGDLTFALEVKWVRKNKPDITSDLEKLTGCQQAEAWLPYLCIFGKESDVANVKLTAGSKEFGKIITADFKRTKYACRIYKLQPSITA